MIHVKKVRDQQLAAPADSESLQSLVVNEIKMKKHVSAEGLLWLVRCLGLVSMASRWDTNLMSSALDFTAQALRLNISNPTEELSTSFRTAYTNTLKPHHSFLVKPVFSAAMSATPYKQDFYTKLASDEKKLQRALETWLSALEKQVSILKQFQSQQKAKW